MKKASRKNSKHKLFFVDASHFVLGCDFLGGVWSKTRRFIKTFSGRQRYNVLGAIDYVSKKVTTVTNDTYITANEVCKLLRSLADEYVGKSIHVVLDNARYQKCEMVTSLAAELGIELVYLPSYSPNLNLIERLWKYTKNKLRVKYYNDFQVFKSTIDTIIDDAGGKSKAEVSKLINEKVQLFDEFEPIEKNTFIKCEKLNNRAA